MKKFVPFTLKVETLEEAIVLSGKLSSSLTRTSAPELGEYLVNPAIEQALDTADFALYDRVSDFFELDHYPVKDVEWSLNGEDLNLSLVNCYAPVPVTPSDLGEIKRVLEILEGQSDG